MIYLLLGSKTFLLKKKKEKKKRKKGVPLMIAVELLGHKSHACQSPWPPVCFGIGALCFSVSVQCDGAFLEKVEQHLGSEIGFNH